MSDRKLRKSTQEASEKTKYRLEARSSRRELKKLSSSYSELLAIEERELSEVADNMYTQGNSETSREGFVEVFEDDEGRSGED